MEEPEGPRPANRFQPPVIDRWGVEELRAYIAELREEIARAEREIAKRDATKAAADLFFRKPG
ncbi:DUF1192 domain-containing protein [Falsiroseomonas bella]|jgi:uncharacterized small protein (DUF1192 family)|uniref:DUF1192 domain-containing protein n=1 Tax=Falsiroseomonas bella TaxID=2184016 RepID=A0A317FCH6_9PROT|nr:DUF1192 domain-containing protein [Falsiroseomonas bella]PWS36801.1 DUF1192 domain-containing protein [Falsiroseomonas bella]